MIHKKKILGIFGNVANSGQERSNCDVFKLIASKDDYDLLVLVNDRGFDWYLKPFFLENRIRYKKIRFPWGIYRTTSFFEILQWIIDIIINNIQFIISYLKFKPNYIHIGNEYMYKTLIFSLYLCRAKIIFRLGDTPYVKHFYNRWFWNKISKRVDTFVCDSNYIYERLLATGRGGGKDIVLYHPAPTRNKTSEININDIKNNNIIFGYLGRITEGKGVKLLLDSALDICNEFPNVEFRFAGSILNNTFFTDSIVPILKNIPDNEKKRISFLGNIEDVDTYLKNINVLIAPSISPEAYGLVLVEAKINHKASIIFQTGGMPELIEHLKTGFICNSKDKKGLLAAIKYYIQHPEDMARHGEAAYQSIKQKKITYENFKRTWISIYQ